MQPFSATFAALSHIFQGFAQTVAPVAVTALWQGIAVTAALAVCLALAPRLSAAHRFAVWSAGFAVVLGLPFLPALAFSATTANASNSAVASRHAWLQLDSRWTLVLGALWLLASAVRAADLLIHSFRLRRLWTSATPLDSNIDLAASRAPGRRFQICTTPHIDRPSVIGFFAPRILIPDWLLARLTPGELEQIVLHESEHLRRGDDWTNLLQKLSLVLFPLNPALWFIERQLARTREMACDEGVVRITHAPRAYAACLASLAERGLNRRTEALSLGAWQRRPELVQRVHSILRGTRTLHPIASRALLGALGCGLLAASFELAHSPQLVAFVPAHVAAPAASLAANHEPTGPIDAAYSSDRPRPANRSQFRAVPAVAKFPAAAPAPINSSAHPRNARPQPDEQPATNSALYVQPAALHAQNLTAKLDVHEAQTNPAQRAEHAQQAEQWMVLTTWEQIETSRPTAASRAIADYDTGTASNPPADSAAQTGASLTRSITVTRLFIRVLPTASQPTTRPASKSTSTSSQPAPVLIGNSWFVFQL